MAIKFSDIFKPLSKGLKDLEGVFSEFDKSFATMDEYMRQEGERIKSAGNTSEIVEEETRSDGTKIVRRIIVQKSE